MLKLKENEIRNCVVVSGKCYIPAPLWSKFKNDFNRFAKRVVHNHKQIVTNFAVERAMPNGKVSVAFAHGRFFPGRLRQDEAPSSSPFIAFFKDMGHLLARMCVGRTGWLNFRRNEFDKCSSGWLRDGQTVYAFGSWAVVMDENYNTVYVEVYDHPITDPPGGTGYYSIEFGDAAPSLFVAGFLGFVDLLASVDFRDRCGGVILAHYDGATGVRLGAGEKAIPYLGMRMPRRSKTTKRCH